jgi:hypothetical protein
MAEKGVERYVQIREFLATFLPVIEQLLQETGRDYQTAKGRHSF